MIAAALKQTSTLKSNLLLLWFVSDFIMMYYQLAGSWQVFADRHEKLQVTMAICLQPKQ